MTLGRDGNKRKGAASGADNVRAMEMFGRLSTRLEQLQGSLDRLNDDVRETLQRLEGELHEVRSFVSKTFEENARYATEATEIPPEKTDSKIDEGPDWLERGGSHYPDVGGESAPSKGQCHDDDDEDDWLVGPSSAMPSEPPDRDSAYLGSSPSDGFRGSKTGDIESDLSSLLEDSDWGDDGEDLEIEDHPPRSSPKRAEEESWSLDDEGLDIEDEPPPAQSRAGRVSGPLDSDRGNQAEGYRPSGSEDPRSTSRQGRRRKPRQYSGGRKEADFNEGNRRSYEEPGRKGSRSSRRRKQERRTKARRQRSQVEGLTGRRRPPGRSQSDASPPREQVEGFDSLLNDYLADDE